MLTQNKTMGGQPVSPPFDSYHPSYRRSDRYGRYSSGDRKLPRPASTRHTVNAGHPNLDPGYYRPSGSYRKPFISSSSTVISRSTSFRPSPADAPAPAPPSHPIDEPKAQPSTFIPEWMLRSNHVPSPSEITQIRSIITQKLTVMEELNKRKEETCAILREIEEKIEDSENEVGEYNALLSPARRIPLEILWQIFHQSSESWSIAPLVLASVCRRWREAAHAEPSIWGNIRLPTQNPTSAESASNSPDPLFLLNHYLEKSQCSPLTLNIDFDSLSSSLTDRLGAEQSRTTIQTMFGLLNSQTHRWKEVNINISDSLMHDFFHSDDVVTVRDAPLLRSLDVKVTRALPTASSPSRPPTPTPTPVLTTLLTAPRLHSLSLVGISVDWNAISPLLPPLRKLVIRDVRGNPAITMDRVLEVLETCDKLEHLEIPLNVLNDRIRSRAFLPPVYTAATALGPAAVAVRPRSQIAMSRSSSRSTTGANNTHSDEHYIVRPTLHTFILELYAPLDPGPLISFLVLPSLRALSIRILGREVLRTRQWRYLGELIARSGCGTVLEELEVSGLLIDEGNVPGGSATGTNWRDWGVWSFGRKTQLRSDLEKMPMLRKLTLKHSTVADDVFEAMGMMGSERGFPALGDGVEDDEDEDEGGGGSRRNGNGEVVRPILSQLTHLHLQHCNSFSVDALVGMLVSRNGSAGMLEHMDGANDSGSVPVPLKHLHIDNCTHLRVGHCALIHSIAKAASNGMSNNGENGSAGNGNGGGLQAKLFFYDETGRERYEMASSGSARSRSPGLEMR